MGRESFRAVPTACHNQPMNLFSCQYTVVPDQGAGTHGVYSKHVKYVTGKGSPSDIDFWVSRDWLGTPHPHRLRLFFRSVDVEPPEPWDFFRLKMRLPGDTRREYCSVEVDGRGNTAITGVYVDAPSLSEPPPQDLMLWVLGRHA